MYKYKVCRPVSCRLVEFQAGSVKGYDKILEQFKIHQIEKQLDAVDRMTRHCGYPSPQWLRAMVIKLYEQMSKIRVHSKKNCKKILQPDMDISPTIQMWYGRIHAYSQLIRMKEGKTKDTGNIVHYARRQHINKPDKLTMKELQDGL